MLRAQVNVKTNRGNVESSISIGLVCLIHVVIYDNIECESYDSECTITDSSRMTRPTRPVSWIQAAFREFSTFPKGAQSICLTALTIAADGGTADIAKPLWGLGSGVFEIALPFVKSIKLERG